MVWGNCLIKSEWHACGLDIQDVSPKPQHTIFLVLLQITQLRMDAFIFQLHLVFFVHVSKNGMSPKRSDEDKIYFQIVQHAVSHHTIYIFRTSCTPASAVHAVKTLAADARFNYCVQPFVVAPGLVAVASHVIPIKWHLALPFRNAAVLQSECQQLAQAHNRYLSNNT